VFLTGEPGSGKTHTVSEYIRYLKRHDIEPAITASTGIAATHVGGMTIHAWSGVGIKRFLSEYDLDALDSREPLVKRLTRAKVLVIDEISMLDGVVLGLVDKVLRSIRRKDEAFGGVQVIFVGDFFQLPPIPEKHEGDGPRPIPQFAFLSDAWKGANPLVCYLTEQHRQDDGTFLSALSMIRSGDLDESLGEVFEDCRVTDGLPENVPLLFTHNVDVDKKNEEELAKLDGEVHEFVMLSSGKPALVEQMKRGCLSPERLRLKEGAAVMFTKNDFERGYVNGSLGTIEGFDEDDGMPIVRLRSGGEIKAEPEEWSVSDGDKKLASLNQIPLRLAWAITVHKSQGMSLDAAVMDLSRAFEYGQGYVALSRVRTISGLYLLGANRRAFEVHPIVLERDREMRRRSDEAEAVFGRLDEKELRAMHENFITASGGSLEEQEIATESPLRAEKKRDTKLVTKELLLAKKKVGEIATERGLKQTTILGHIEELREEDKSLDIAHLVEEIDAGLLARIHDAMRQLEGTDEEGRLTPVKRLVPDASFDDIRFARLFLG
jgi:hypothetical protein